MDRILANEGILATECIHAMSASKDSFSVDYPVSIFLKYRLSKSCRKVIVLRIVVDLMVCPQKVHF